MASAELREHRDYAAGDVVRERYELVSPLGAGGMGVVWHAHDRVLNVDVALKLVLHPSAEAAARARTEARAAARLSHPAVCRVADYGHSERGDPFVVSELLAGETFADVLERRGRLRGCEAVRLLLPILDALEAAHASGIVHRDVKPANVVLARLADGSVQPKLVDFGIARWLQDRTRHTSTGCVVGTPDYMSPEQARGSRDIGPASDVWSFCATLYEALSGSLPFYGENYNAVLWAILNTEPPPLPVEAREDQALAVIVLRGLRRDSANRWTSARELAQELARWLLRQDVETDVCGYSVRSRATERLVWLERVRLPETSLPSRSAATVPAARLVAKPPRGWRRVSSRAAVGAAGLLALASSAWALKLAGRAPVEERGVAGSPLSEPQAATLEEVPAPSAPVAPDVPSPSAGPGDPVAVSALPLVEGDSDSDGPPAAPETASAPDPTPVTTRTPDPQRLDATGPAARPPAARAETTEPTRKTNALGYDFGL